VCLSECIQSVFLSSSVMNFAKAFNGDLANEKPITLLVFFSAASVTSQFATKVSSVFYPTGRSNGTMDSLFGRSSVFDINP